MKDKYDKAVEYLTAHPEEIAAAWRRSYAVEHGCLFQFVSPSGLRRVQSLTRQAFAGRGFGPYFVLKVGHQWRTKNLMASRSDISSQPATGG